MSDNAQGRMRVNDLPSTAITWAKPDDSWGEPSLMLCCPVCAYDYQHHSDVIEFWRPEGEDHATYRVCRDEMAKTNENPSPRRDAVRIMFKGECGHVWWLDVIQHKGQTFAFARTESEGDA